MVNHKILRSAFKGNLHPIPMLKVLKNFCKSLTNIHDDKNGITN